MEPLTHPVWRQRVRCIASLLVAPMPLADIEKAASKAWGWPEHLAAQAVCAGEGAELRARRVDGVWLYGRVPGRYSDEGARELATFETNPKDKGYNAKAPLSITRRCPGCKATYKPRTMGQKFCTRFCARKHKGKV